MRQSANTAPSQTQPYVARTCSGKTAITTNHKPIFDRCSATLFSGKDEGLPALSNDPALAKTGANSAPYTHFGLEVRWESSPEASPPAEPSPFPLACYAPRARNNVEKGLLCAKGYRLERNRGAALSANFTES